MGGNRTFRKGPSPASPTSSTPLHRPVGSNPVSQKLRAAKRNARVGTDNRHPIPPCVSFRRCRIDGRSDLGDTVGGKATLNGMLAHRGFIRCDIYAIDLV